MARRAVLPSGKHAAIRARAAVEARIGEQIARFQEGTSHVDDAAAAVLDLGRPELAAITALLFQGPQTRGALARSLRRQGRELDGIIERLSLAGYVRWAPAAEERMEITEHAREWIATIWTPIEQEAPRLFRRFSTAQLAGLAELLEQACDLQERHAERIRALNERPRVRGRANRLRGGLAPAALRRVQLYVEANLGDPIHIADLAGRAGLSAFHFARAFKTSMGITPRLFVERRRIERARALIADSELSLSAVAVEAGFGTQSRLTTAFRRATGLTPAVYRRGHRR